MQGIIGFTGCSGVSEEQIAELEALRSEVKALEKEFGSLKTKKRQSREIRKRTQSLINAQKEAETKRISKNRDVINKFINDGGFK